MGIGALYHHTSKQEGPEYVFLQYHALVIYDVTLILSRLKLRRHMDEVTGEQRELSPV